jgi:group I intron endonuclease
LINLLTEDSYIGQSRDIEKRMQSHFSDRKFPQTKIEWAIKTYGRENFRYEILCECSEEELDEKEVYYMKLYDTIDDGYNVRPSGQHDLRGEGNTNVKLSEQDVWNIREAYKNHADKWTTYIPYQNKLTKYSFSSLWEGSSWKYVHMDVYTEDNIKYYSKERTNGERSPTAAFTNAEVLNCRTRYINESAASIYADYSDRCSFQAFQEMLWGRRYKEVPVYSKIKKQWI